MNAHVKACVLRLLCLLFVLFVTPAIFAQVDDGSGVENKDGISDGCGDTMNPDVCMGLSDNGTGWSQTICRQEACPACGFNNTMTASICFRLYGNYGYCTCSGGGIGRDKNGNKVALCSNTTGSCAPLR